MRAIEALLVLALLTAWIAGFVLVLRTSAGAARGGASASTAAGTARCSSSSSARGSAR